MNKVVALNIKSPKDGVQSVLINIDTTDTRKASLIKAVPNAQYELVDQSTMTAPQNIVFKRSGSDLYIAFVDEHVDMVIENFYATPHSGVVGFAEDGKLYAYVPESGYQVDYVPYLPDGAASWNALGGTPLAGDNSASYKATTSAAYTLSSNTASTTATASSDHSSFGVGQAIGWPQFLGLTAIGLAAYAIDHSRSTTPAPADAHIVTIQDDKASTTITNLTDGAVTHDTMPTVVGTGAAGTTVNITADGHALGSTTVGGDGYWSYTPTTDMATGSYVIGATTNDPLNLVPNTSQFHVTIAPAADSAGIINYNNIGTHDIVIGTAAKENFSVNSLDFDKLDAGAGVDTLTLAGTNLNLNLATAHVSHFENIDLGNNHNSLTLSLSDVVNMGSSYTDHALTILGTGTVDLDTTWSKVTTGSIAPTGYDAYHNAADATSNSLHDLWIQNTLQII